jgi:hypothetical protein
MAIERKRPHRARRIALATAGPLALVIVLAQAVLPGVAADRARARVEKYGTVESVSVSALPAIELLWGSVDSVGLRARELTLSLEQVAALLWEARKVGNVDATVRSATLRAPGSPNGLSASDIHVRKRGSSVTATASVTQAQLDASLPGGIGARLLRSGPEGVTVRASGALFGIGASIDVLVRPFEGRVIAEPIGVPFGSLASLTLFSDPHIQVRTIAVGAVPGRPSTYAVSLGAVVG